MKHKSVKLGDRLKSNRGDYATHHEVVGFDDNGVPVRADGYLWYGSAWSSSESVEKKRKRAREYQIQKREDPYYRLRFNIYRRNRELGYLESPTYDEVVGWHFPWRSEYPIEQHGEWHVDHNGSGVLSTMRPLWAAQNLKKGIRDAEMAALMEENRELRRENQSLRTRLSLGLQQAVSS